MQRPRLLLVPQVCALDWQIAPLLSEWAEVATYDPPGVGDEPAAGEIGRDAIARRGLDELDRLGWVMQARDPLMRTTLDDLAARDVPMLFAEHDGCMMFTPEGYADAVAAFPRAQAVSIAQKPSASPAFAEALREFCLGL